MHKITSVHRQESPPWRENRLLLCRRASDLDTGPVRWQPKQRDVIADPVYPRNLRAEKLNSRCRRRWRSIRFDERIVFATLPYC
jgi:hypothetical protein